MDVKQLDSVYLKLADWLLPKHCLCCGTACNGATGVCVQCMPNLPYLKHGCDRCGQPYTADTDVCGRCLHSPPPFDHFFSVFSYQTPIKEAVQRLKYANNPFLAKQLAGLMAEEVNAREAAIPELLVPVPIHINRLRHRGYNQAALLSRHLSDELGVAWSPDLVKKHRDTTPQASLTLKQRQINLRGCFSLQKKQPPTHIAIVDDVMTSGATAAELAKLFRAAGVEHIQVWVFAQAL